MRRLRSERYLKLNVLLICSSEIRYKGKHSLQNKICAPTMCQESSFIMQRIVSSHNNSSLETAFGCPFTNCNIVSGFFYLPYSTEPIEPISGGAPVQLRSTLPQAFLRAKGEDKAKKGRVKGIVNIGP